MKRLQTYNARLITLGSWFAEDPWRLTVVVAAITVLISVLAHMSGHSGVVPVQGIQLGPNPGGGSGGSG